MGNKTNSFISVFVATCDEQFALNFMLWITKLCNNLMLWINEFDVCTICVLFVFDSFGLVLFVSIYFNMYALLVPYLRAVVREKKSWCNKTHFFVPSISFLVPYFGQLLEMLLGVAWKPDIRSNTYVSTVFHKKIGLLRAKADGAVSADVALLLGAVVELSDLLRSRVPFFG